MILNVITLLLVAAITFMHSIFGFFSGVINVFCTIVSLTVAFGFFEPLNDLVTANVGIPPTYCEPACLIVLFLISFLVLRTLADNYIRGNVRVPMAVDWGGAAVCGLINAQLIVGMMVIALDMLPVRDPTSMAVLGYGAYQRNPDFPNDDHPGLTRFDRTPLWTRSDEFTAWLFSYLSGGSLRGETAFASVYPDFAEAVFYSTNTVQPESVTSPARGGRQGDGFKDGLKVDGWWEVDGPIDARYRKAIPTAREPRPDYERRTFEPMSGMKVICVDMTLRKAGGDRKKNSVMHLFRPTQLRLVGKAGNRYEQFVPVILANTDEVLKGAPRIVDLDNNFSIGEASARIYAYYEVPQEFRPTFVEYRRHARAALGPPEEEPGSIVLTMAGADEEKETTSEKARSVRFWSIAATPISCRFRLLRQFVAWSARRHARRWGAGLGPLLWLGVAADAGQGRSEGRRHQVAGRKAFVAGALQAG